MNKRIIYIFMIVLLILFVMFFTWYFMRDAPAVTNPDTTQGVLDFTPYPDEAMITIPTTNGLKMQANSYEQVVDFYNPASNPCYMKISLYLSDGTKIYQSENLMPSERITNITLLEPLQKGLYKNCRIVYECFDLQTNAPLNGGQMTIEIQSR